MIVVLACFAVAVVAGAAKGVTGSEIVTTYAGTGSSEFNGDGIPATSAALGLPLDVETDAAGDLYIAEQLGNRVRKVDASTGLVSTVAGTGAYSAGGSGDGGPATAAQIGGVTGLALDATGNLYISENVENYITRIRKVDAATGIITTLLDMGAGHFVADLEIGPDGYLYASHHYPYDVANTSYVFKIDPATGGTTVVPGTTSLDLPAGLAFDGAGNLFVSEYFGNRVRRIDRITGVITTVAGTGSPGSSGDGGPALLAELNNPSPLVFDSAGDLYVGEYAGRKVRKIDVTGLISTVAGTGAAGYSGDGGPAIDATFNTPASLTFDPGGTLYISDTYNNRIRRLAAPTPPNVVVNTNDSGPGSLRAAIEFANTNPGPDTIEFAIPPTDPGFNGQWFTIHLVATLPAVTDDGTTIGGSTQTAFSGDTNPVGPEIELNGTGVPFGAGFNLESSSNRIDSLVVNGFSQPTMDGIHIGGSGNVVTGSYIGLDPTGRVAVANNQGVGISGPGTGNRVGGTSAAERNVISGNSGQGMNILGGASGNLVEGNFIGTDRTGAAAVPNGFSGIFLSGGAVNTVIGGTMAGARNVISGNTQAGVSVFGNSNVVQGNYVGTDAAGTSALPNAFTGVEIHADGTMVAGNVLSGNGEGGINVANGDGTVIVGNRIGTDAAGTAALANGGSGVFVFGSNTTVGGPNPGDGNLISGNAGGGVQVCGFPGCTASGITVHGNRIGTNATGTAAIPFSGVVFFNTASSAITGNLISGGGDGIHLQPGTTGVVVQGNRIGTNADGTAALGNLFGIQVGGTNNTIGGTSAAERNLISGSTLAGVALNDSASGNVVQGNYVGTNADGTAAIPNGANGIGIRGSNNTIGGASAGAGNLVAFNGGEGVVVFSGTGSAMSRNSIFANGGLGIDLTGDGVTPNDPGDADTGANELMNFPVLKNAAGGPGKTTVVGTIDTPNPQSVVIELFANPPGGGDPTGYGEGMTFLGTATPNPAGHFTAQVAAVAKGTLITATATDAAGNTSEFAANIAAK